MWYRSARRALFAMDAETVHGRVMRTLDIVAGSKTLRRSISKKIVKDSRLELTLAGVDLPNPIGLAAGFDKNASHLHALEMFGFGAIEIGTVTGEGQDGNPKPRMFRVPEDRALLNRMGFNNAGAEAVRTNLETKPRSGILGVNFGKTKVVAVEDAAADYEKSLRTLHSFADYFVVNVSSPNTPGLRSLQGKEPLLALLTHLSDVNARLSVDVKRPMFVKVAPDLNIDQLDDVLDVIDQVELDGIVCTNTTIDRSALTVDIEPLGAGGISGAPLTKRSRGMVAHVYRETNGAVPVIGVGGVFNADDALAMIRSGASFVQVWTGFIYSGPSIVNDINSGLLRACEKLGVQSIADLTGEDVR